MGGITVEENKVIDMNVEEEIGQVQIADDVIAVIAEIAALEVEGIISVGGGKPDIVQSIRGKKASKGIRIEVSADQVFVDIVGTVKYGVKIQDVCLKVQEKVKNSIETMTGLDVKAVDIRIAGVYFPKEKSTEEY